MKHRSKRFLSVLLSLVLLLGLMGGMSLTAFAQNVCPECKSTDIEYFDGCWMCYDCQATFDEPDQDDGGGGQTGSRGACPYCSSSNIWYDEDEDWW